MTTPRPGYAAEADSNVTLVSTATGQGVSNPDYRAEVEAWRNDREIAYLMRSNSNSSL